MIITSCFYLFLSIFLHELRLEGRTLILPERVVYLVILNWQKKKKCKHTRLNIKQTQDRLGSKSVIQQGTTLSSRKYLSGLKMLLRRHGWGYIACNIQDRPTAKNYSTQNVNSTEETLL